MISDSHRPTVVILAVGLTRRWLAHAPRLTQLAEGGAAYPLREVLPAVTSTAQASMLTGRTPQEHGIVANGWLFRDTREIRFWQQSNALLQTEPIYQTLKRHFASQGKNFTVAKLFWWFNQGADVDISITPKPHYGCDGNKVFDVTGFPSDLIEKVHRELGPFPFFTFWGPGAGPGCSEWITRSAALVLEAGPPDLTFVYVPHLDYDPQRFGPTRCAMPAKVRELDDALSPLLDQARRVNARVAVVSEYGHVDVETPVYLNRLLREHGWIDVRMGPFGEMLDTFTSRAIAVCDHQFAHVYVQKLADVPAVRALLTETPGVARTYVGEEREEVGLDHPRSGEIVVASQPKSWFAYPYWLDDHRAPDFARTVDIHRKPGFDPCEMFLDPALSMPKLRIARRLIAKKLGFRMKMDVIPLDARIVRGSHGLRADDADDQPVMVVSEKSPVEPKCVTDVYRWMMESATGSEEL